MQSSIILFDGHCNLCNGVVDFVIKRDRNNQFLFASLQSAKGQELLQKFGVAGEEEAARTFFLIEKGKLYRRSTAALHVARKLSGAWPLFYGFIIIPAALRDLVYKLVSRNRYKWFGRSDTCRLPTPAEQARFL